MDGIELVEIEERPPFEADPEITVLVETLLELTSKLGRGDFLPHETIEAATGETRYAGHWSAMMERFAKALLGTRGIALYNERGRGYWLATHTQQVVQISEDRTRRALRQNGRIAKTLDAIPEGELSVQMRAARSRIIEQAQKARSQARVGLKVLRAVFGGLVAKAAKRTRKRAQMKAPRVDKSRPTQPWI